MSLHHLLPAHGVEHLMTAWPDHPEVYERGSAEVDQLVTAEWLWEHIDLGCVPPVEVRALKDSVPSITHHAYSTYDRLDGARLRGLYGRGYTIRLGNLQRVMPVLARISRGIQQETGYSNYVHAFLTPGGRQGLRHHWDQQMALIVQVAGVKRWQLWRPVVASPMRDVNTSHGVWRDDFVQEWEKTGPDLEVDLRPGQTLLLPRGWVHNPFVPADSAEGSVHLTFAVRERTPFWMAEQILAGALHDAEFRRVVLPGEIFGAGLPGLLDDVRRRLVAHLSTVDADRLARYVARAATTDLEYTT